MEKKIKNRFRTNFNSHLFPKNYEVNSGEKITVPDMAYTVEQILNKFTRGVNLNIYNDPEYSDSNDFDIPDNMVISDLTDLEDLVKVQALRELKFRQMSKSKGGTVELKDSTKKGQLGDINKLTKNEVEVSEANTISGTPL